MRSQISFIGPIIAGIVVGISTMIVTILIRLTGTLTSTSMGEGGDLAGGMDVQALTELFKIPNIIPSFYLQLIVGIYIVEIIFILTILSNSIEHGADKLNEKAELSKNLYMGGMLYFFIALIVTVIFTFLSISILQ